MKISERDIERILLELVDEGFASMYTQDGTRNYEVFNEAVIGNNSGCGSGIIGDASSSRSSQSH